jgi:Cysteine-rich CPCC
MEIPSRQIQEQLYHKNGCGNILRIMESNHNTEKQPCPCCGDRTLDDRRRFEICPVCFWQDDGQDDIDADIVCGGPNGTLSLTQARQNYQEFGSCDFSFKLANCIAGANPNGRIQTSSF